MLGQTLGPESCGISGEEAVLHPEDELAARASRNPWPWEFACEMHVLRDQGVGPTREKQAGVVQRTTQHEDSGQGSTGTRSPTEVRCQELPWEGVGTRP